MLELSTYLSDCNVFSHFNSVTLCCFTIYCNKCTSWNRINKDEQRTYNVIMRLVRKTTVAVEKQLVVHILSVYLQP
jgi:hypothetical protein